MIYMAIIMSKIETLKQTGINKINTDIVLKHVATISEAILLIAFITALIISLYIGNYLYLKNKMSHNSINEILMLSSDELP